MFGFYSVMDVLPALPVGFRFRPTDQELINHYLRLKINGYDDDVSCIREVDVCKKEPWDLPGMPVSKIPVLSLHRNVVS